MKRLCTKENFLYLFILISPFLDLCSSLCKLDNYSISLILRPIIPCALLTYIYITDKSARKVLTIGGAIYLTYMVIHLLLYRNLITDYSYGGISYEASYVANYTYLIFTLYLFIYVFKKIDTSNLKKYFLIYVIVYITSIYLAILTKTSFPTYIEGYGYRGWFNTGGAVGSILIGSLFILLPYLFGNKDKLIWKFILITSIIFYLVFLIGTRTGMFGSLISLGSYFGIWLISLIVNSKKMNKKMFIIGILIFATLISGITVFGSNTLERRKHLENIDGKVPDGSSDETIYMAYDLVKLKEQIENGEISSDMMTKEEKEAILKLDNYSRNSKLSSTDQRKQQLIYHHYLYNLQDNILLKLFGNGYLTNIGMLTLEMEIIALFYNFGILGLLLFMGPFFAIFIYGIIKGAKSLKKTDISYWMTILGCFMTYVISVLAGHTYFNASVMIVIIILHTLLYINASHLKGELESEKSTVCDH